MSPFLTILFVLLGLFVLLVSHDLFSCGRIIAAFDGTEQERLTERQRLRHHKKAPVGGLKVLPRSSSIISRKQLTPNNGLESSSKSQQEQSTTTHLKSSSTIVRRQVQDTDFQCGDNQSLFRFEVTTDRRPWQTSWILVDVSSNTLVMGYDNFDLKESIYIEEKCLESNLCYQFTIYDSAGNGMCCGFGQGSCKVKYDNQLINKGKGVSFRSKKQSGLFGDEYACMILLSAPSSSTPSTNSEKPTTSFEPTSSPTELQDVISYNKDDSNRRFFVPSPLLLEDAPTKDIVASYHTWPNCSAVDLPMVIVWWWAVYRSPRVSFLQQLLLGLELFILERLRSAKGVNVICKSP